MIHLRTMAAMLALASSGPALADPGRDLINLAAGEERIVQGVTIRAAVPSLALVSLSSEFTTVAVIDGKLTSGKHAAGPGDALVTPIDSGRTERLTFDAARLKPSLRPEWLATAAAPLDAVAARQKRAKFWGRLEPAGINASAPVGAEMEVVRQSYLGNATIADLRRAAKGDPQALAALTVKRFAEALAAGDAQVVADLIDPKPFTDTGAVAGAWQAARLAFATKLTANEALKAAMATPADAPGAFTIQLVARDRAMFVAAVEPKL